MDAVLGISTIGEEQYKGHGNQEQSGGHHEGGDFGHESPTPPTNVSFFPRLLYLSFPRYAPVNYLVIL